MKKFGHTYGFSVVLLVLMISSCDKTVPTLPEASAPIFTLDGEFDGEVDNKKNPLYLHYIHFSLDGFSKNPTFQ